MPKDMNSDSWLIVELLALLALLGGLCFFFQPAYEKGLWAIVSVIATVLSMIVTAKYARKMPEQATDQRPGQSSQSETTTKTTPLPAPEAPPVPPDPKP